MKLLIKIFKVIAVVVIVFIIALFTASFIFRDKVAEVIIRSLNEKITTKFDIGSVSLSFLRKFPNASLELKNVLVHSSPGFDTSCFSDVSTDTLLSARSVSVEFRITDVINGVYNIGRIGIKQGVLILLADTAGRVNYDIAVGDTANSEKEKEFVLNLDRINLQELKASYINSATSLVIKGLIGNGRLKSRIAGEKIDFNADAQLQINLFRLYDFTVSKSISTIVDVSLHSSDNGVVFDKSSLIFDGYTFGLSGTVSSDDILDLALTGDNIDISGIRNYLPESFSRQVSGYNPEGKLSITGKITGLAAGTINPGIEISSTLENGSVSYLNSALTIKDLSFNCLFSNGSERTPATSMLTINNFKGNLGSAAYSGSFFFTDFDSLQTDILLSGKVIPSELKDFFNIREIGMSEGSADVVLKLHGFIPEKKKYSIRDLLNLDPAADMHFNSFGIGLKESNLNFEKVTGSLHIDEIIAAENFSFKYRGHDFTVNGSFINLPGWMLGDPVILSFTADATCTKLIPESLFPESFTNDTTASDNKAVSLPGDVIFDLNFTTDSLRFRDFRSGKVKGVISYKPRIINIKTLVLNSLDGLISGDGFIVQNTDKSFLGRGMFTLEDINIKKTFVSFNNFGQDFIKSENLDGTLSGKISILMPMDSLMKPVMKSLTAEGKYTITNGVLAGFDPLKSLSSFIELSELENIRFEKLENDFFIRNNVLFTPQMDIKSSAADLSASGQHSFDNDYEYHIKILLSELLSKKLKKPKPNTTEFGAVRDDGLGRTSLFLRIEDKGDDIKVGYDVKAAAEGIKSNIKAERQNLKTILNQEYGWFKNDTSVQQKPQAGTPRFKITWDETDTVKADTAPPVVKKESVIRNIFRKK